MFLIQFIQVRFYLSNFHFIRLEIDDKCRDGWNENSNENRFFEKSVYLSYLWYVAIFFCFDVH